MKNKIFLIIMCVSCLLLFGCNKTKESTDSIKNEEMFHSFMFTFGNDIDGYQDYNIIVSKDTNVFKIDIQGKEQINKQISLNQAKKVQSLITKYNIKSWNGYVPTDNYSEKDENFNISIEYEDYEINGWSYKVFPENYDIFKEELIKCIKEMK